METEQYSTVGYLGSLHLANARYKSKVETYSGSAMVVSMAATEVVTGKCPGVDYG
jgi:hypothetical protein